MKLKGLIASKQSRRDQGLELDRWCKSNRLIYAIYISVLGVVISLTMLVFDRIFIPDAAPFLLQRLVGLGLYLALLMSARFLKAKQYQGQWFSSFLLCAPVFIYEFQYLYFIFGIEHSQFFVYFIGNLLGAFCGTFILNRFWKEQCLFTTVSITPLGAAAFLLPQGVDNISILIIVHIVGATVAVYMRRDFSRFLLLEANERERTRALMEQEYTTYKAIALSTQKVAHDIMKPFANIRAILHQMNAGKIDKDKLAEYVRYVEIAAIDVEGILGDLLLIGSRRFDSQEAIDIPALIQEIWIGLVYFREAIADVNFSTDFGHTSPVYTNKVRLKRILTNLIKNAIEATEVSGDPRVWVSSKDVSGSDVARCSITVGNSDKSIPEDEVNKIFDAFYTKGKKGGTGLGLAICLELAAQCQATLQWSPAQEGGNEFILILPNRTPEHAEFFEIRERNPV